MNTIRKLFLDIETAPNLAYIWGVYQQDAVAFEKEWYILSFSAKWEGGRHITKALPDYREYVVGSENDKELVKEVRDLLDEADVVVAHNGVDFDLKKLNSRFIYWNLPPPSPYKTIDTCKIAQKSFGFNSNKLEYLAEHFGIGKKLNRDGFSMWLGCLRGDRAAWKNLKRYNKNDVVLLEGVYHRLLPWITNHPITSLYQSGAVCPRCGSAKLQRRGFAYNKTTKYQRVQCLECGGWSRETLNLAPKQALIPV